MPQKRSGPRPPLESSRTPRPLRAAPRRGHAPLTTPAARRGPLRGIPLKPHGSLTASPPPSGGPRVGAAPLPPLRPDAGRSGGYPLIPHGSLTASPPPSGGPRVGASPLPGGPARAARGYPRTPLESSRTPRPLRAAPRRGQAPLQPQRPDTGRAGDTPAPPWRPMASLEPFVPNLRAEGIFHPLRPPAERVLAPTLCPTLRVDTAWAYLHLCQ